MIFGWFSISISDSRSAFRTGTLHERPWHARTPHPKRYCIMKKAASNPSHASRENELRAATAKAQSADKTALAASSRARAAKLQAKEARKAYKHLKKAAKRAAKVARQAQEELKALVDTVAAEKRQAAARARRSAARRPAVKTTAVKAKPVKAKPVKATAVKAKAVSRSVRKRKPAPRKRPESRLPAAPAEVIISPLAPPESMPFDPQPTSLDAESTPQSGANAADL